LLNIGFEFRDAERKLLLGKSVVSFSETQIRCRIGFRGHYPGHGAAFLSAVAKPFGLDSMIDSSAQLSRGRFHGKAPVPNPTILVRVICPGRDRPESYPQGLD
jgi:hypothetical protein